MPGMIVATTHSSPRSRERVAEGNILVVGGPCYVPDIFDGEGGPFKIRGIAVYEPKVMPFFRFGIGVTLRCERPLGTIGMHEVVPGDRTARVLMDRGCSVFIRFVCAPLLKTEVSLFGAVFFDGCRFNGKIRRKSPRFVGRLAQADAALTGG